MADLVISVQGAERARSSAAFTKSIDWNVEAFLDVDDLRVISIYSCLSSLYKSEKFTDMTICCGGRRFKVHRAIVCPQCPFFDKAMSSAFMEGRTQVLSLPTDDPDVLEKFLEFLYTGNYSYQLTSPKEPDDVCMMTPDEIQEELQTDPGVTVLEGEPIKPRRPGDDDESEEEYFDEDEPNHDGSSLDPDRPPTPSEPEEEYNENPAGEGHPPSAPEPDREEEKSPDDWINERHTHSDLFLHMRMYVMADKFGVPILKLLARNRFYRAAELSWKEAEEFPDIVDEIYETHPKERALADIVCRLVGSVLTQDDHQRRRLEPVMRKHGDFAVDVMAYMIRDKTLSWA